MTGKIKVLIVDDHAILRMGLTALLNSKKDIEVVGDAANGPSGIVKALRLKPDVVIMDLAMPDMDGAETTRQLLAKVPDAKVMILTTFGTADGISHALDAGALGAVMKNVEFTELVDAIRTIAGGGRYVSPEIERILEADPPIPSLSPRQAEILSSLVRGLSNVDIASQLGISLDMVKEHTTSLFAKLGVANRTEAVAIAMRKHLVRS
ncbi:MAG: response regulator transcription factor [Kiritimatiellae bacterium]|nr:response regulator transcription factor [Kiritimatiellia bacterium]